MKRFTVSVFFVLLMVVLTACNSTGDALVEYNNEFILEEYAPAEEKYNDMVIEHEQIIDEDDLEKRIDFSENEVIPISQEVVDLVKQKEFEDEVVQEVHELLIESEELQLEANQKELEALQEDSSEMLDEAIEIGNEAADYRDEFLNELESLYDEYDLEDVEE